MPDRLSVEQRSRLMSRIKSRDTKIEHFVRRELWHAGFRYRLQVRSLPGTPDLVLKKYGTVVFVHGCFWHGHDCPKGRNRPSTNLGYWDPKLARNISRDREHVQQLCKSGWKVRTIWECSLQHDTERLLEELTRRRSRQSASVT